MKITDVRTIHLQHEMPHWIFNAVTGHNIRNCLIIEILTDEGLIGVGEAGCYSYPTIVREIIDRVSKPVLLGKDPFQIANLWAAQNSRMGNIGSNGYAMMALSGIDIALWDLLGKSTGMPVYRLLGGFTDKVMAYATCGFYAIGKGIPELMEEYRGAARNGFQMMKMKVGRQDSVVCPQNKVASVSQGEDIERVAAVREAIGPNRKLMVDVNCGWDPCTAIKMGRQLEKYDIYFLEEPVAATDIAGSSLVAASLDVPVAGYETEVTLSGFRELILNRAVDVVQPDVILSGGFTESRKIAALAEAHNMLCVPHSFTTGISLLANAHLLASLVNGGPLEFKYVPDPFFSELLTVSPAVDPEGYFHLPAKPGLGIELNPNTVDRYKKD